jgi:membrane protein
MPLRKLRGALEAAALIGFWFSLTGRQPRLEGEAPRQDRGDAVAPSVDAGSPAQFPAQGWWEIVKRVAKDFSDNRVMAEAASVTFYALLAIFPAMAALISLYGLIADPRTISAHLSGLAGVIPEGGLQILTDQIKTLTSTPQKALGFGAITGLLISLWSANAGVKSMIDALNAVYSERETRSFLHLTWLSFCFTIGILCFVILAVGAVVVLPAVLNFIGLGSATDMLLSILRWPLLLLAIGLFLGFLYRYGPSRHKAKWRWVSWGSGFASIAWVLGSLAFSFYVANFGSYNRTYGSLGAAVGFMTWIWISAIIVLTGAELNAELENETRQAATEARPDRQRHSGGESHDRQGW